MSLLQNSGLVFQGALSILLWSMMLSMEFTLTKACNTGTGSCLVLCGEVKRMKRRVVLVQFHLCGCPHSYCASRRCCVAAEVAAADGHLQHSRVEV
jgi:hypothetical protein